MISRRGNVKDSLRYVTHPEAEPDFLSGWTNWMDSLDTVSGWTVLMDFLDGLFRWTVWMDWLDRLS